MDDAYGARPPEKDKTRLTVGYYILKMLPSWILFIITAAIYLCCAYLFLRVFFAINGETFEMSLVFGRYADPVNALLMLALGLAGGLIIFFMVVALFFLLTSLLFPLKILRSMFIRNANIAFARVIKLWDDDLRKSDDRCDADIIVAARDTDNFRARVKVPVGPGHNITDGSKIMVAYSFEKGNKKAIEKIISVTRFELTNEQFLALLKPVETEGPDEQDADGQDSDGMGSQASEDGSFENAEFTVMESIDGGNFDDFAGEHDM